MAERSLDQMINEEFRRVAGGQAMSKSVGGLLGTVATAAKAPVSPKAQAPNAIGTEAQQTPAAPKSLGTQTPKVPMTSAGSSSSAAKSGGPVVPAPFVPSAKTNAVSSAAVNKSYSEPSAVSPAPSSSNASVAGGIGQTALKVFTSGLGLMPMISGLVGLFGGGGGSTTPTPLTKYAMPRSIQIQAANSSHNGSFQSADYGQDGMARVFDGGVGGGTGPNWPTGSSMTGPAAASPQASQIVVNVQAMDSQSFMDHSQDIAQAVREAMLNMHPLNDVVSEL